MNFLQRKIDSWKIRWNQCKKIPTYYPFIMKENEKLFLNKHLKKASNYLEFGLGGSTIFALIHTEIPITSIDTNTDWINFMKKYSIVKHNLGNRLTIQYEDIGPTKSWGFPVGNDHKEKFPNFSSGIFKTKSSDLFDLILVDGRFRVACVLAIILNRKSNLDDLTILVHDYSIRDDYKFVEKYLNIIESVDTLYAFKIKSEIDYDQLKEDYEYYKYIPV